MFRTFGKPNIDVFLEIEMKETDFFML